MSNRRFTSQAQGLARRKPCWACLDCKTAYPQKRDKCLCSGDLQYFASTGEYRRWIVLLHDEVAGRIQDLTLQPVFLLDVNGHRIGRYTADFQYIKDETTIVEDVKARQTEAFKLRKKLVLAIHGVDVLLTKPSTKTPSLHFDS